MVDVAVVVFIMRPNYFFPSDNQIQFNHMNNWTQFILRNISKAKIFVNIANENIASIKLHEGIGFKKISNGAINSCGDYRSHKWIFAWKAYVDANI